MAMTIHKKYPVPIYGGARKTGVVHVVMIDASGYSRLIGKIDKQDKQECEWPEYDEFSGLAYERTLIEGGHDWWVIFNSKRKLTVDTIAHEALHISRMILHNRGVDFDPENDEPYAYMVGWVSDVIYKTLKQYVE
jgi:hypothetical protein